MCSGIRLEEYLDGELQGGEPAAVEAHLAGCAACRSELEELRRLETVLRAVPPGMLPDADRFVQKVRSRSRTGGRAWMAMAAALLAGLAALLVWPVTGPAGVDLRAAFEEYLRKPAHEPEAALAAHPEEAAPILRAAMDHSEERVRFAAASILYKFAAPDEQARIRTRYAHPAALARLESALGEGDVRLQFEAAKLFFLVADEGTANRVLARHPSRADSNGSILLDAGGDTTDIEMLPVAVSALEIRGQERWAIDVLRKLQWLNLEAKKRVVDSVVTLLKHENPRIQGLALEIARELDIEFPLSAIVDLLDSPDLGAQALKALRDATKKDFGTDKAAWRQAVR